MNKPKKKRKRAKIRQSKKINNSAKVPRSVAITRQKIEAKLERVRRCLAADQSIINKDERQLRRYKNFGIWCSPVFILVSALLGANLLSSIVFSLALIPWIKFYLVRENLVHWKDSHKRNSEYAEHLYFRLQCFD